MSIAVGVDQRPARIDLSTGAITWLETAQPVVSALDTNPGETGWAMLAGGATQPSTAWYAPKLGGPLVQLAAPQLLPPEWPATPSRRVAWKNGRYGHGQVLLVGDLLLVQTEQGPVALAEAKPDAFHEAAKLDALHAKTWNTPALAGGYLLVRNDQEAACFKLPLVAAADAAKTP